MTGRLRTWLSRPHGGAPGWVLVLVVLVLVGAGSAYAVRSAASPARTTTPVHPIAAFIGDSYAQGVGATTPADRWTTLVSHASGWRERNLGRGGTGYVTTSDVNGCGLEFCPNYQQMVQPAVDDDPDIVVVSGGQNDFSAWSSDSADVTAGIETVYRTLRRSLPNATIYAVGPSTTGGVGGPVVEMDAAVRAAAKRYDAHYVSLISPDVIVRSMVLKDGGHVDDAGHAAIAKRVLNVVRAGGAA